MSELDPLERRRRQREAARRRNLTLGILGGGLLVVGLTVAVVVLLLGKRGGPDAPDLPGITAPSDPPFVAGSIVTVEGEVGLSSATPGKVVVILKSPGGKSLTCVFPPEAYGERWHHDTRRGGTLKLTGRVDEVYERSVRLVDCKFISQVLKK